ncbi:MAG: T9SS type A sorting domain-containing protein [Agriterribacter sp.]
MIKKFTIVTLCIIACNLLYSQGVKQVWGLTGNNSQIFSVDTAHFNFTIRKQMDGYPILLDFAVLNGKVYGTQKSQSFLYEFDPLYNHLLERVPYSGYYAQRVAPVSDLVREGNKIWGITDQAIRSQYIGDPDLYILEYAPIYMWDGETQEFSEIIGEPVPAELNGPAGGMTAWNGKFYGMTVGGGENGTGNIYEFDPITNTTVSKFSFPSGVSIWDSYSNRKKLTLVGNKFYGIGINVLFEWDPQSNVFEIKHHFTNGEGRGAGGSLVALNGKLYGGTMWHDLTPNCILFEWDPAGAGTYTQKIFLSTYNAIFPDYVPLASLGDKVYGMCQENGGAFNFTFFKWDPATNDFTLTPVSIPNDMITGFQVIPAPVSMVTPNSCATFPSVTVNAATNSWVPITDSKGDVLAEIQPHNNNLGLLDVEAYINDEALRTDGAGKPYLNRNITITPATQPAEGSPVDIRLYITKSEFEALKAAPNSGITDISDLAIFKNSEGCPGNINNAEEITTTYEDYEFGYVLKATITSFSTFYFSKRTSGVLPLQFLNFTVKQQNSDALLQWITDNEHNTRDFDIERSIDGIHFTTIDNTAAKNINGKHSYNYIDKNIDLLTASIIYYRIKQRDLDGNFDYSKTESIHLSTQNIFFVSPNPAENVITLSYKKQQSNNVTLQIIDVSGKKVLEQKINTQMLTHKINISSLAKGVYMISVIDNNERQTTKFVKQ